MHKDKNGKDFKLGVVYKFSSESPTWNGALIRSKGIVRGNFFIGTLLERPGSGLSSFEVGEAITLPINQCVEYYHAECQAKLVDIFNTNFKDL